MKSGAPHPLDVADVPLSPEAGREEVLRRLRFARSAGLDDLQERALTLHCRGESLGEIARALNVHRRRARAAIVLGADRLLDAERRAAEAVLPLLANVAITEPLLIEMPDGSMVPLRMDGGAEDDRIRLHPELIDVCDMVAPFERAVAAAV